MEKKRGRPRRKRLIFIRHGKAEKATRVRSDSERSLTPGGKKKAARMASLLHTVEKEPGAVFTSPAFRTVETALLLLSEYDLHPSSMKICPELSLESGLEEMLSFLRSLDEGTGTCVIAGHNPALSSVARYLAISEIDDIVKSGVVCLSFGTGKWAGLDKGCGRIEYILTPASLK